MMFEKKTIIHIYFEHAKGLLKHYQISSNFEQWDFISNEILKGKEIDNPISYAPLVIFQRYKITVLSTIHTPCGFV
jgi:hypothetical protein